MKKIVIFFVFIIVGSIAFGQTNKTAGYSYNENFALKSLDDFFILQRNNGEAPKNYLSVKNVKGSPYLFDEFVKGAVIIENFKFTDIPLRYNIYNDEIEYKKGESILAIANGHDIRRVIIDNVVFGYYAFTVKNVNNFGYFQLLSDGRAKVLKKYSVSYQMPKAAQAYTVATPPQFVRLGTKLFVKIGNAPAQQYANAKKLLTAFGDKKSVMAKYFKEEKLNIKRDEDLIKCINYYNSL